MVRAGGSDQKSSIFLAGCSLRIVLVWEEGRAGAGIGGVFGGDRSAVGCFDLANLPNHGQKENRLIKLVNAVSRSPA